MSAINLRKMALLSLLLWLLPAGWIAATDLSEIRNRGAIQVAARPVSTLIYSPGNGDYPGFCFELAREFARFLGVGIEVQQVDTFRAYWQRGEDQTSLLLLNEVDLYAEILTVTPGRKELLFMTPYVENTEILIGNVDSRATDLTDLIGKRVAVIEGMSFQQILENALSQKKITYRRVAAMLEDGRIVPQYLEGTPTTQNDAATSVQILLLPPGTPTTMMLFPEQLALGTVDFFIIDSFSLFHQLNVSQALRHMVRPLFPINESIGELAFGSSLDSLELNSVLDRWMQEFRTTPAYEALFRKYIGIPYVRYRDFIEDFPG